MDRGENDDVGALPPREDRRQQLQPVEHRRMVLREWYLLLGLLVFGVYDVAVVVVVVPPPRHFSW